MSSLFRRIHGVFDFTNTCLLSSRTLLLSSHNYLSSSPTTTTPIPQTKPETDFRSSSKTKMFEERDLRTLVDNFKRLCETDRFRKQHSLYIEIVRRLVAAKQFSWVEEILEEQKKYDSIKLEGFTVQIIRLYGVSGMFDHALKVFDEMPLLNCERTVKSFNALLGACVNSKRFGRVEEIFRDVPVKLSIKPDVRSYNNVVKAFCGMGSLDSAVSTVDEMERNGVKPDSITYSLLLDGFYQNGRFLDGDRVWKLMKTKGIVRCVRCYNAKLRRLASEKCMLEAVELFEELRSKGLKPDICTINALIKGFCDDNNFWEARKWYRELTKYGCHPDSMTVGILVPLACEMADIGLALELCNEAVSRLCVLDAATLQGVVDGLVKESMVEEAKKLVESIQQSNGYYSCELKLPVDK